MLHKFSHTPVTDKVLIKEKKLEELKKKEELEEERKKKKRDDLVQNDKFTTRKQMDIEQMERDRIDEAKEEAKRIAEEDVYSAFAKMKEAELAEEKTKQKQIEKKKEKEMEKEKEKSAPVPSHAKNDSNEPFSAYSITINRRRMPA